ncbi:MULTISPECIES: chromate transporter [Flavobacterium]|jgi:chromate transporter|uniref:chromate transporter n=1 Tax=Flavobacterium TaxID=237 RepID=UPI000C67A88A|nr:MULTISPECIES: chromate transporter [Flavobacterium]PIF62609.1 putative chromate ion transporter [Flavobacterium sp. 11]
MKENPKYSLKELLLYFLKLGTIGFGGPVALVGYMHRDLVEDQKWISEDEYKEGLALAQLAPGPLAAQLAIYLGFVHCGFLGATLIGFAFILPSFIMVVLFRNRLQVIRRIVLDTSCFLWRRCSCYWYYCNEFL